MSSSQPTSDRTTVYSTYYNPIEANIIRARLEDSGFACFLADENVATINPLYNQAIGGVKLIVFEKDVDEINLLLGADQVLYIDQENEVSESSSQTICSNCGSSDVGYGMATKKQFTWWVKLLALLTITYPIKANKCHHCYNCGHEFP